MLLGAMFSDRAPAKRHQFVFPCCLIVAFGLAACGFSNAPGIAIPALCFISIGYFGMQGAFLAIVQGLFRGRSAAAAIAAINTLSILGGFVGPYFMGFLKDVTGNYQRGLVILSIPMLLCAGIMVYLSRQATLTGPRMVATAPRAQVRPESCGLMRTARPPGAVGRIPSTIRFRK